MIRQIVGRILGSYVSWRCLYLLGHSELEIDRKFGWSGLLVGEGRDYYACSSRGRRCCRNCDRF